MARLHILLAMLMAMPTISMAQAPAAIEQLRWLAGCWTIDGADEGSVEHWLEPAGGAMFAVSRTVKQGRVAQFEFMTIRTNAEGSLVFVAQPRGVPPTEFPAASVGPAEAIFENSRHDFPNRVIYRQTGPASMLGRIEGVMDGKPLTVDFNFTRTRCPNPAAIPADPPPAPPVQ